MKAIKFFVAAMAMTFAMSANAQLFSDGHFTANVNLGSIAKSGGFGLGVGYQTEVFTNDWITLAWDVAHFEWDAPFDSPGDIDELSIKTGARAFSPSFCNEKLRAYTNFAMGYTCILAKGIDWDGPYEVLGYDAKMKARSAFGLTWGVGIQYNQKWSLGYTLQFESNGKSKNHFATIGYTF